MSFLEAGSDQRTTSSPAAVLPKGDQTGPGGGEFHFPGKKPCADNHGARRANWTTDDPRLIWVRPVLLELAHAKKWQSKSLDGGARPPLARPNGVNVQPIQRGAVGEVGPHAAHTVVDEVVLSRRVRAQLQRRSQGDGGLL